jgi:hypothetical protein
MTSIILELAYTVGHVKDSEFPKEVTDGELRPLNFAKLCEGMLRNQTAEPSPYSTVVEALPRCAVFTNAWLPISGR